MREATALNDGIPGDPGKIALVGMPGCGKSTIGRQLARVRQLSFLDIDHEIERFIGGAIAAFFAREGEEAFRDVEQQVIAASMAGPGAAVIATGGGAILRNTNRTLLRTSATVVYLRAAPDDLARRLSRDTHRPLLRVADPRQRLRELFAQRDPYYREVAHLTIETSRKSALMLVSLLSMQLDMMPPRGHDAEQTR